MIVFSCGVFVWCVRVRVMGLCFEHSIAIYGAMAQGSEKLTFEHLPLSVLSQAAPLCCMTMRATAQQELALALAGGGILYM